MSTGAWTFERLDYNNLYWLLKIGVGTTLESRAGYPGRGCQYSFLVNTACAQGRCVHPPQERGLFSPEALGSKWPFDPSTGERQRRDGWGKRPPLCCNGDRQPAAAKLLDRRRNPVTSAAHVAISSGGIPQKVDQKINKTMVMHGIQMSKQGEKGKLSLD